jgi:hypothetical protein
MSAPAPHACAQTRERRRRCSPRIASPPSPQDAARALNRSFAYDVLVLASVAICARHLANSPHRHRPRCARPGSELEIRPTPQSAGCSPTARSITSTPGRRRVRRIRSFASHALVLGYCLDLREASGKQPSPIQASMCQAGQRPRDLATSRPRDLATSRPRDLATWRPRDLETWRPRDLETSRCQAGSDLELSFRSLSSPMLQSSGHSLPIGYRRNRLA